MSTVLDSISTGIRNWWWFIIKGVLLVVAGGAIFSRPLEGYVGLSILFSIVILGSGFTQVFFATANSGVLKGSGWTLASGILDVIIGAWLLTYPVITMATIPFIVGFWLLFKAFYLVGASFDLKSIGLPGWGWLLAGGILVLILGFFVLRYPGAGAISIVYVSGSAFIMAGIGNIYLALRFKSIKNTAKDIKEKLQHAHA